MQTIVRSAEAAYIALQSPTQVGQAEVLFIPDQSRDHRTGFGAVPLLPGFCENPEAKPVAFAGMGDYLFHGDPPLHLLAEFLIPAARHAVSG